MGSDPVAAILDHSLQATLAVSFGIAWLAAEWYARRSTFRQGAEARPSSRLDSGTYPIIAIALGASLAVVLVSFLFGWGGYLPIWVAWLGVVLLLLGIPMRVWALVTLGRFFTMPITLREDHRIVRDGPYRYLRHPAYTAGLLMGVGMALILATPVGIGVSIAALLAAYVYRIHREEQILISRFGDAYRDYSARTWRLVPMIY